MKKNHPMVGDRVRLRNMGHLDGAEATVRKSIGPGDWYVDISTFNDIARRTPLSDNWCWWEDDKWEIVFVAAALKKKTQGSVTTVYVNVDDAIKALAAKNAGSPWNGKCSRCGKGTYQGLVKLEHEGGICA